MFFKIISFDMEVLPLNKQMPKSETCPILLISCQFNSEYEIETVRTRKVVLILTKRENKIELSSDRVVEYFTDESLMINKFFYIIKEYNPDIVCGYNINGFDIPYVIDRSRVLGIRNIRLGCGDSNLYYRKYISKKGFTTVTIGGVIGRMIFDVLYVMRREDETNVFKKEYNLKKLTLEHVAKEILKIEKLDFSIEEMEKYWNDTSNVELRNKFINYCSRDSELPLMLLTKFRLLDKFISLSRASGRLCQDVINSSGSGILVENLLMKEFKKNDRLFPIRVYSGVSKRELEGAEVKEPKLGVSENLCSIDYKSLYPTLMIKHNLCYSTQITEIGEEGLKKLGLTKDDVEVQTDEMGNPFATFIKKEKYKGIVPQILERLLLLRASQKKEMKKYEKGTSEYLLWDASQNASKILLNSHYGYSGDDTAKIYSWAVASAVTTTGRKQIKRTWKIITDEIGTIIIDSRKFRLKVVQGDTDSSYLTIIAFDDLPISRDEAVSVINNVLNKVNSTLEKPMELAFENYIKRIIITAKKRYAYLSVDDKGKESVTSKGLETIRREWCNYSSDTMEQVINFVLKESTVSEGIKKSIALIKEKVKLLNKGEIVFNDLILSKKLSKTDYDNKQVHVQVAIKMKERGRASEVGDRIQYVIIDNGKKLVSEKAEEAGFVLENINKYKIDKNYYIYQQLIPPSLRLLESLGVRKEEVISNLDDKQMSLELFWSFR